MAPAASRRFAPAALAALAALLAGCTAHHYVVVAERAPLHEGPEGERVLAHLPRFHHEPLAEDPLERERGGRVPIVYRGQRGWAPRAALRLFGYLSPALDGGADRDLRVAEELREAQLETIGRDWPEAVVAAIRERRVIAGMTRRQVEVAWGWPQTLTPGDATAEERWLYRQEEVEVVRHWVGDAWVVDPWCHPRWGWHRDPSWRSGGWVTLRVPVLVERTLTFDRGGRVSRVTSRRALP